MWNATDVDGGPFPDERQPFSVVKATGRPAYDIRHGIKWPDGRFIILSVNASPMLDREGKFSGMVATFEDITGKIRNEKEMINQLEEKTILLKEVHHRIKNNIVSIEGLLSLQLQSTSNPETVSALQDAIGRVGSMRILYEKLLIGDGYEDVSVRNYLESLTDAVVSLYPQNRGIRVEKQLCDFDLSSKQVFSLGIILNELLTNIMKYAFDGKRQGLVVISLSNRHDQAELTIQDNGKGLPEGFDIGTSKGFGLMLVRMLSEQLGGQFAIETSNGTRSVLRFSVG